MLLPGGLSLFLSVFRVICIQKQKPREEFRSNSGTFSGLEIPTGWRHGTPIPIDDVEETSIGIDRFPLHLLGPKACQVVWWKFGSKKGW